MAHTRNECEALRAGNALFRSISANESAALRAGSALLLASCPPRPPIPSVGQVHDAGHVSRRCLPGCGPGPMAGRCRESFAAPEVGRGTPPSPKDGAAGQGAAAEAQESL